MTYKCQCGRAFNRRAAETLCPICEFMAGKKHDPSLCACGKAAVTVVIDIWKDKASETYLCLACFAKRGLL